MSCRSSWFACPLIGCNHYFATAVEVHVDDMNHVLLSTRYLIDLASQADSEYFKTLVNHVCGLLSNFRDLLECEAQLSLEYIADRENRCRMESLDSQIALYGLRISIDRMLQVADAKAFDKDHQRQTLSAIKSIFTLIANKLMKAVSRASSCILQFALGDRLRELTNDCKIARKAFGNDCEIASEKDFEILCSNWRALTRKFSPLLYQLITAILAGPEPEHDVKRLKMFHIDVFLDQNMEHYMHMRTELGMAIDDIGIANLSLFSDNLSQSSVELQSKINDSAKQIVELQKSIRDELRYVHSKLLRKLIPLFVETCENVKNRIEQLTDSDNEQGNDDHKSSSNATLLQKFEEFSLYSQSHLRELLHHVKDLKKEGAADYNRVDFAMFEKKISNGSFGTVFASEGRTSVVKRVKVDCTSEDSVMVVWREVETAMKLKHHGVVTYRGNWMGDEVSGENGILYETEEKALTSVNGVLTLSSSSEFRYVYISLEYYKNGTLDQWLRANNAQEQRSVEKMKRWLAQLCEALAFIHRCGLIHRDVKPANIFLSDEEQMVIGDFGLVWVPEKQAPNDESSDYETEMTAFVGTLKYMAFEVVTDPTYTNKVDVYSLGLVYYDMVVADEKWALLLWGEEITEEPPLEICEAVDVCRRLTKTDPNDRPTCEELLQSDYLKHIELCCRFAKSDAEQPAATSFTQKEPRQCVVA